MTRIGRIFVASALMGAGMGAGAAAQGFEGAEFSGELLTYSGGAELVANNYRGSLEFGVLGVGLQADLAFYNVENTDTVRGTTLHASYDLPMATVGLFYAREAGDTTSWGVEAAGKLGPAKAEGWLGFGDAGSESFRTLGAEAEVALGRAFAFTASFASVDTDLGGAGRVSAGGQWQWGERGPVVYAEIGRLTDAPDGGPDSSARFIGIGARLAIGPNHGTTFESRGLAEVVSSF